MHVQQIYIPLVAGLRALLFCLLRPVFRCRALDCGPAGMACERTGVCKRRSLHDGIGFKCRCRMPRLEPGVEFNAAAEVRDALFGHLDFYVSAGSDRAGVSCSCSLLGGQARYALFPWRDGRSSSRAAGHSGCSASFCAGIGLGSQWFYRLSQSVGLKLRDL